MEERYSRHHLLEEVGPQGQRKISSARILIIGAGGLGCPALQYLCSSGVDTLRVVDADVVSLSNLPRQILYGPEDIGRKKVDVLTDVLKRMNPEVTLELIPEMADRNNIEVLIDGVDVVLDCTDNYQLRYLLSDTVQGKELPVVYAALHKFEGQLSVFNHKGSPTFRTLFPDEDKVANIPTCMEAGVFSVLPGIMGVMQAAEALKIILDKPGVLSDRILLYNTLNNTQTSFKTGKIGEEVS